MQTSNKRNGFVVAGLIITGLIAVASIALLILERPTAPVADSAPAPTAPKPMTLGTLKWAENPAPVAAAKFTDAAGASKTFADFAGRVLVVNFWATWCAPCVEEMPSLNALQANLGGEGFAVVAVNQDRKGAEVAQPFLEKHGWTSLSLYTDPRSEAVRDTQVRGLPTSLVIDRKGREVARLEGTTDWNSPEMVATLKKLIEEP